MDTNEVAKKMLEWGDAQSKADALKAEIQAAVLEIGETQNAGNVTASYSAGRVTKDYDAVKDSIPPEVVERYSTVSVAWAKACKDAGIDAPDKSKSAPSVLVKFKK